MTTKFVLAPPPASPPAKAEPQAPKAGTKAQDKKAGGELRRLSALDAAGPLDTAGVHGVSAGHG